TKRQFVRFGGLSIADRILPRRLHAEFPRSQNRVIIVTFGGGVRYSATFSSAGVRNIPRLVGLVEYINGARAPTSGDELTFFITREVMREFAPRLLLVNFRDMDVAQWGSYPLYLQAITKTDWLCGMLWDEVQFNPNYRRETTVLILPELGRIVDVNAGNGFLNHRSGDRSCRNGWLLAL